MHSCYFACHLQPFRVMDGVTGRWEVHLVAQKLQQSESQPRTSRSGEPMYVSIHSLETSICFGIALSESGELMASIIRWHQCQIWVQCSQQHPSLRLHDNDNCTINYRRKGRETRGRCVQIIRSAEKASCREEPGPEQRFRKSSGSRRKQSQTLLPMQLGHCWTRSSPSAAAIAEY